MLDVLVTVIVIIIILDFGPDIIGLIKSYFNSKTNKGGKNENVQ